MTALLEFVAVVFAAVLAVPVGVVFLECVAGLWPRRQRLADFPGARGPAAVVVPAHDEEAGLGRTLDGIKRELGPGDRLVVVCDNCSDRTAEIARLGGAEVLERSDPDRRGKGYALSFALEALRKDPPAVVVVVDADCTVGEGAIERLVRLALQTGRPAQSDYVLELPARATIRARVSAFAIRVRNRVRLAGLARLGGTSQLVGSGMAFPWDVLDGAEAMRDNLVEDLALGIDAALRGHPPVFCPEAKVTSVLPSTDRAALTQRRRWETGQLATLRRAAGRLVFTGFARRDRALVALGLDLVVPPLSLLMVLLLAGVALALAAAVLGASFPLILVALDLVVAGAAITAAWIRVGREVLPWHAALTIPGYLFWKVPLYLGLFSKRAEKRWVRTERAAP